MVPRSAQGMHRVSWKSRRTPVEAFRRRPGIKVQHVAEIDKDAFRAAVVHDMRAPLNACLMSLSLIELKAAQPAEVMRSVEVIRRNLERQALLIDDLGDALQLVEGGLALEREDVDLVAITDSAAQQVREATGVGFEWSGGRPADVEISADPERLGRAIGTALEVIASEAGTDGRLTLSAERKGDRVRIAVHRPGTQTEAPPRRKRPVMRLTVADAIVAWHDGQLEVGEDHAAIVLPAPR